MSLSPDPINVAVSLYGHHSQEKGIRTGWRLPISFVSICDVLEHETKEQVRLKGQDLPSNSIMLSGRLSKKAN